MGGAVGLFPLVLIGLIVLVAVAVWTVTSGRKAAERRVPPDAPSLAYEVPAGQDPVVVLTALTTAGYVANADPTQHQLIRIAHPDHTRPSREHVRAVIGSVHTTALDAGVPFDPGTVRFTDET